VGIPQNDRHSNNLRSSLHSAIPSGILNGTGVFPPLADEGSPTIGFAAHFVYEGAFALKRILLFFLLTISLCFSHIAAQSQTYKVLYNFGSSPNDGLSPITNLVADSAGNLYGSANAGGIPGACYGGGCGTIFEISPDGYGGWSEKTLYYFCQGGSGFNCPDGGNPNSLAIDKAGNLFGTTTTGGNLVQNGVCNGCGVAFELSPPSQPGENWIYTLLYTFCKASDADCADGAVPEGPLTIDAAGNLYGTAFYGGNRLFDAGVAFALSSASGEWNERVIYDFCSVLVGVNCEDGEGPLWGMTFNAAGDLYGTTVAGGADKLTGGAVFKLTSSAKAWTEKVLVAFPIVRANNVLLSAQPGVVSFDPDGNFYTTLLYGGNFQSFYDGSGAVVRVTRSGQKSSFLFDGADGGNPAYGVIVDARRKAVFGVSGLDGFSHGNLFEISAGGKETVLYNFCQQSGCSDGDGPSGALYEDNLGNFYGVTQGGGANLDGVVFELTP